MLNVRAYLFETCLDSFSHITSEGCHIYSIFYRSELQGLVGCDKIAQVL